MSFCLMCSAAFGADLNFRYDPDINSCILFTKNIKGDNLHISYSSKHKFVFLLELGSEPNGDVISDSLLEPVDIVDNNYSYSRIRPGGIIVGHPLTPVFTAPRSLLFRQYIEDSLAFPLLSLGVKKGYLSFYRNEVLFSSFSFEHKEVAWGDFENCYWELQ